MSEPSNICAVLGGSTSCSSSEPSNISLKPVTLSDKADQKSWAKKWSPWTGPEGTCLYPAEGVQICRNQPMVNIGMRALSNTLLRCSSRPSSVLTRLSSVCLCFRTFPLFPRGRRARCIVTQLKPALRQAEQQGAPLPHQSFLCLHCWQARRGAVSIPMRCNSARLMRRGRYEDEPERGYTWGLKSRPAGHDVPTARPTDICLTGCGETPMLSLLCKRASVPVATIPKSCNARHFATSQFGTDRFPLTLEYFRRAASSQMQSL